MTAQELTLFLGAFGIFLGLLGGGGKWLLSHIAANTLASELREQEARTELSKRLREEIEGLRVELSKLREEKSLHLRRIYHLEYFIHDQRPRLEIPNMKDWPPT